ncbi:protein ACCELERATED CELL DEATH 6-like [Phoenix dactylifera]|uniref:Protein ACCELERATED CELL DEATH 6-like n=1 Tax=Phoenix dactylifera TaxID=42345 RepID=A0A8B8ZPR5_PHODC|nr:protein ACCELERATED CELL DEATH 6-like [Phoenix dactylifera]
MLAKGVDSSGRIPLHYAALYGHHDTVKLLLKHDPSTAYQPDANGSFPIHIAASRGNVPIIDQILKQCPGTDELLDEWGRNFLHVAFKRGKLDVVKKIISKRPDLRKLLNDEDNAHSYEDTSCLLSVTLEGNTVLHIVANRGHLEIAKKICRKEISLLVAANTRLDTPLYCAARAGDDKMVSLIIQFAREGEIEKKRVLRAKNRDEANALHEAAKYNHRSVAKVLMEEDAGLASMPNSIGMSPLYLAIAAGSLDVAKALLRSSSSEKASPASYGGPNKKTALHAAVLLSREITEDILQWKPMLAKGVDCSGRIPLHYVASDGHHDMAKLLLKHDPSTAFLSDANGLFPIHIAAMMGNITIVDQILKQCPDADELLDQDGKNFLHVAFESGKLDVVRKIISKRPDLKKLLNDQDNKGNTPLHTAVKYNDQGSVHFLLRDKTVCINVINHDGFTPLDLAYSMSVEDQQFQRNAAEVSYIASCLAFTKAVSGPRELHDSESGKLSTGETKEKLSGDDKFKKLPRIEVDFGRDYVLVSLLIATVTFAAGFTVPGGYVADDHPGRGTAVLAKEYAFKVFLVSDATALVCSLVATSWLIIAGMSTTNIDTRRRANLGAINCLRVASLGMSAAFAMGICVMLPPSCKRVSILLCFIVLGFPLLHGLVSNYDSRSFLKTMSIRQEYRECICPTRHPHDKKRLGLPWPGGRAIWLPLTRLGTYAIFFLLAML